MLTASRITCIATALSCALAITSCTEEPVTGPVTRTIALDESDGDEPRMCGIDMSRAQRVLKSDKIGSAGTDTISTEYVEWQEYERWICNVGFFGAASIEIRLGPSSKDRAMRTSSAVPIGNGVNGAVTRQSDYGWTRNIGGYVTFRYTKAPGRVDSFKIAAEAFDENDVSKRPSNRQLATAFVLTANAVRRSIGCEGDPLPMPTKLVNP